jgi:hypothetical protein
MLNKKLIFLLSLFGLGMAFLTLMRIPPYVELPIWLAIYLFSAYWIAKMASGKYFLHGFYLNMLNSAWVTSVHILFFKIYLSNHMKEAIRLAKLPLHLYPDLWLLIIGVLFGAFFGLILGLFSSLLARQLNRKTSSLL